MVWIDNINYQLNFKLNISSNNLSIDNTYQYPMIKFPTNTSFIKTSNMTNDIGGFIAVVNLLDKEYNYLYSPINENSNLNFKFIGYNNSNDSTNTNISNIDLHS